VNYYIDNFDLLYGGKPIKVSEENEGVLQERALAFSWGFKGKETMLLKHGM